MTKNNPFLFLFYNFLLNRHLTDFYVEKHLGLLIFQGFQVLFNILISKIFKSVFIFYPLPQQLPEGVVRLLTQLLPQAVPVKVIMLCRQYMLIDQQQYFQQPVV